MIESGFSHRNVSQTNNHAEIHSQKFNGRNQDVGIVSIVAAGPTAAQGQRVPTPFLDTGWNAARFAYQTGILRLHRLLAGVRLAPISPHKKNIFRESLVDSCGNVLLINRVTDACLALPAACLGLGRFRATARDDIRAASHGTSDIPRGIYPSA
jgi:hypothetical protein